MLTLLFRPGREEEVRAFVDARLGKDFTSPRKALDLQIALLARRLTASL